MTALSRLPLYEIQSIIQGAEILALEIFSFLVIIFFCRGIGFASKRSNDKCFRQKRIRETICYPNIDDISDKCKLLIPYLSCSFSMEYEDDANIAANQDKINNNIYLITLDSSKNKYVTKLFLLQEIRKCVILIITAIRNRGKNVVIKL